MVFIVRAYPMPYSSRSNREDRIPYPLSPANAGDPDLDQISSRELTHSGWHLRISVRGWSGRLPWCDPRMDRGTWRYDQSCGGSIRDLGLAWICWARGPTLARMRDEILPLPSFDSLAAVCLGLYDCLLTQDMIYLVSICLLVSVSVCAFGYGGQSRQNRPREQKTG